MRYTDLHPVVRATIEGKPTDDIPYVSPLRDDGLREQLCYVVQSGVGPVKIGVAACVADRVGNLQVGNPEQLHLRHTFSGGYFTERALHSIFAHKKVRGEWFDASVLETIEHHVTRLWGNGENAA